MSDNDWIYVPRPNDEIEVNGQKRFSITIEANKQYQLRIQYPILKSAYYKPDIADRTIRNINNTGERITSVINHLNGHYYNYFAEESPNRRTELSKKGFDMIIPIPKFNADTLTIELEDLSELIMGQEEDIDEKHMIAQLIEAPELTESRVRTIEYCGFDYQRPEYELQYENTVNAIVIFGMTSRFDMIDDIIKEITIIDTLDNKTYYGTQSRYNNWLKYDIKWPKDAYNIIPLDKETGNIKIKVEYNCRCRYVFIYGLMIE